LGHKKILKNAKQVR